MIWFIIIVVVLIASVIGWQTVKERYSLIEFMIKNQSTNRISFSDKQMMWDWLETVEPTDEKPFNSEWVQIEIAKGIHKRLKTLEENNVIIT